MSENDVIINKEKKEKKDKKKDKKKKKDSKKLDTLGDSVDSLSLKSSDEYDDARFKPVRNPAFNPALTSPLSSPIASRNSTISDSNGGNDEKWTISLKNKDMPRIQTNTGANSGPNAEKSPLTPAELQGYAAQKFVPTGSYAHLDPSKSENAYAAFNHLQKVIMANKEGTEANQPPGNDSAQQRVKQQPQPQQQQKQQQQPRAQAQAQQPRYVAQQSPPAKQSPLAKQSLPANQQQQQQHLQPHRHPVQGQQQQQQQPTKQKPRAERLADGAPVLQYCRALWNYTAQVMFCFK